LFLRWGQPRACCGPKRRLCTVGFSTSPSRQSRTLPEYFDLHYAQTKRTTMDKRTTPVSMSEDTSLEHLAAWRRPTRRKRGPRETIHRTAWPTGPRARRLFQPSCFGAETRLQHAVRPCPVGAVSLRGALFEKRGSFPWLSIGLPSRWSPYRHRRKPWWPLDSRAARKAPHGKMRLASRSECDAPKTIEKWAHTPFLRYFKNSASPKAPDGRRGDASRGGRPD